VAQLEADIVDAGAEIIWVLEQSQFAEPGTAELCVEVLGLLGSVDKGWCVGDSQTGPESYAFDESEIAMQRGFDLIVDRTTMEIVWTSTHGTPSGNENLDGEAVLAAVKESVNGG
jgi:hypothetical protein